MSAMQCLRYSRGVPSVTRFAQPPSFHHARFQSTAAAPESPARSAKRRPRTKAPRGLGRHARASELDKLLAPKRGSQRPSVLDLDIEQLIKELHSLQDRRRRLARTLRGPFRVRMHIESGVQRITEQVVCENNEIQLQGTRIPNIWLRDNCQCSSCVHESTKQRLQDTFKIPRDLAITKAEFTRGANPKETRITVEWSDGHRSEYSQRFLANATVGFDQRAIVRQGLVNPTLWTSETARKPPEVSCDAAIAFNMAPVLRKIRTHGFCYITSTDPTPSATEALLRRIAFIRETHYGGFYDFTADLASKDTAYTNIALEAHTDNTYFSDPAGLQAFHLLSHTDGTGGASLLVDGFKVADDLQKEDPDAYRVLSEVNVHAHASGNEGISIQAYRGFPVLEHDPATGDLLRVRWNSADRAGIELPIGEVEVWYDAARKFDALLKKKENEYWEQLVPGRVLVFDNWRMLHGRSSFTGKRRICGGYINRDDWISRFKMGGFGRETVFGFERGKVLAALAAS